MEKESINPLFPDKKAIMEALPTVKKFTTLMAYYRCAIMEIETKFNVLNEEFSLQYDRNPINGMKSRLKSLGSIADKLERKHLPISVDSIEENLNDIAGVRVVCSFPDDVYMLAEALLKKDLTFTDHMADELLHCARLSAELDARMDALRELVQGQDTV